MVGLFSVCGFYQGRLQGGLGGRLPRMVGCTWGQRSGGRGAHTIILSGHVSPPERETAEDLKRSRLLW